MVNALRREIEEFNLKNAAVPKEAALSSRRGNGRAQ